MSNLDNCHTAIYLTQVEIILKNKKSLLILTAFPLEYHE